MRRLHEQEDRHMSKGGSRTPVPVKRVREAGLSGGSIAVSACPARRVRVESDRTANELRAMDRAYLAVDGVRVVIRRGGGVIAEVITDVESLRRCIEDLGVRYEANLPRTTNELIVPVRPLASR
jgi:hypothetical protein